MSGASATAGGEGALIEVEPVAVWLEPPAPRRGFGLGAGIAAGALAVLGLAAAAALILIAPGAKIAGVPVGGLTPGAAAEKVSTTISSMQITLIGAGEPTTLSGAHLGAHVDAHALAQQVHADSPAWNLSTWHPEALPVALTLDDDEAERRLREAAPAAWTEPVDATVVFDPDAGRYVTTPAVNGLGVDVPALTAAMSEALAAGETSVEFAVTPVPLPAHISDAAATKLRDQLNGMLATAGFYVGEKRAFELDPATVAGWLTIHAHDGVLTVSANEAAIAEIMDEVAQTVNVPPVSAKQIVNSTGTVLQETSGGKVGREIDGLDLIAPAFAEQLASGNGSYALTMKETPFASETVLRKIMVNLTTQRISLLENGEVVDTWKISSGARGTPTHTGTYTVRAKVASQTMTGYETRGGKRFKDPNWKGSTDSEGYAKYKIDNVKWVMYFNGNQALHGVFWHSNWGNRMSHGCVGMPEWRAQQLFEWAPKGIEVTIHN